MSNNHKFFCAMCMETIELTKKKEKSKNKEFCTKCKNIYNYIKYHTCQKTELGGCGQFFDYIVIYKGGQYCQDCYKRINKQNSIKNLFSL